MLDVFINYRTDDEAAYAALLLDEKLCERFGSSRVFRDSRSIPPAEDFRPQLWGALAKATVFIVVVGQGWLRRDEQGHRAVDDPDDFVRREIELALRIGLKVFPVLVGRVPALQAANLPTEIQKLAHQQYRRLSVRGAHDEISRIVDDVAAILDRASVGATARNTSEDVAGTAALLRIENREGRPSWEPQSWYGALRGAVDAAADHAGLGKPELTELNTGLGMVVPASVLPIRVAAQFVSKLDAMLAAEPTLPPVKIALCRGTVDDRLADLTELVCLPELADVLRKARRARLVLAVPDGFFDEVVRANPDLVDPSTFLPFVTGGRRYWAQVPGYSAPPGLTPGRALAAPDAPRQVPAVADNHGTVFLHQGNGNQYTGDHVEGDKHVYGVEARRP